MFGTIRSVELVQENAWYGYEINFQDNKIPAVRLLISKTQTCCEDFGFLMKPSPSALSDGDNDDDKKKETGISNLSLLDRSPLGKDDWKLLQVSMVGQILKSVDWGRSYSRDTGYVYSNTAEIVLQLENGSTIGVLMWNDHNGYYSHSIRLEKHGRTDDQEL